MTSCVLKSGRICSPKEKSNCLKKVEEEDIVTYLMEAQPIVKVAFREPSRNWPIKLRRWVRP